MADDESVTTEEVTPSNNSTNNVTTDHCQEYKVYKRRWYILFVVSILNTSNAMIWITFSPIADVTTHFYDISSSEVNWLSLVYLIASVPFGFLATWLLDTIGLRVSIVLCSWLNCIGSLLRVVSCLEVIPKTYQYILLITGQSLAACAQPFVVFCPTKLAALWFSGNQRATANMLSAMSNPLGIMIANLVSPAIVTSGDKIPFLLQLYSIPAVLSMLMATFGVCSSVPPTPPTVSAEEKSEPFFIGLKQIFQNKSYLILCLSFGTGLGLFTTLSTLIQQILCPHGYDNTFSGLCGALLIGGGVTGAALTGLILDRTKCFEEVIKICSALSSLAGVAFSLLTRYENQRILIAFSITLMGMFGFSLYPACMETAVECTYPVAEATSSGLLFISGQLQGIIFIILMQALAYPLPASESTHAMCNTNSTTGQVDTLDYTDSNLTMCGLMILFCTITLICFFHPELKRVNAEQRAAAQKILSLGESIDQMPINSNSIVDPY